MKAPIALCVIAAATALVGGVTGCAEEAGVTSQDHRYTVPEPSSYAAPSARGQATGVTGEPSGAGGQDLSPTARPGVYGAGQDAEVEQPTGAPSPYRELPPGSVVQPASPAVRGGSATVGGSDATPQPQRTPPAITPQTPTPGTVTPAPRTTTPPPASDAPRATDSTTE